MERIQLKITAPPVDNAANKACINFIAKEFKTSKSMVTIVQGKKNKLKTFSIRDYDKARLEIFLDLVHKNQ